MPANAWARPKRGSEAAKNHGFMDTYFPSNGSGGSDGGSRCRCKHKCTCKSKNKSKSKGEQPARLLQDAPESSSSSSKKKPLGLEAPYDSPGKYSQYSQQSQGSFEQWSQGGKYHSGKVSQDEFGLNHYCRN
jgi:hypothetical protein